MVYITVQLTASSVMRLSVANTSVTAPVAAMPAAGVGEGASGRVSLAAEWPEH